MCNRIFLSILTVSLFNAGGCKQKTYSSVWRATPITIDGKSSDWEGVIGSYDEDADASIGICNDGENLYLLLRFWDKQYLQSLSMGGLTVWFDQTEKRQQKYGFKYRFHLPDSLMPDRPPRPMHGSKGNFPPADFLPPQSPQKDEITVIDSTTGLLSRVAPEGYSGPAAAFGGESGFYTIEFLIPLQGNPDSRYGIKVNPGDRISIGFSVDRPQRRMGKEGGLPQGQMGGGSGSPPNQPPGGMDRPGGGMGGPGGGPGGPMGGGPGGGKPPQRIEGKELKVWITTVLATAP
ncbi:MAG: hypothetical protein NTW14_14885 [bacterium]|nr:hypothetical protein [bacterium]